MARVRLRGLGLTIGSLPTGKFNAITDVAGVKVGYFTLIRDMPHVVRTGITAIWPRGPEIWTDYVFAGTFSFNGNGEMTGLPWIAEQGTLGAPIGITNTYQVGSEAYIENDPATVAAVDLGGTRTFVAVPMLKENELLGAFALARQEVRPFTNRQIELVKSFAAQAVIAIENARLLNELRQRTDDLSLRTTDLTEALEQQTATSEVLGVISGSPGNLEPVFAAMLENAIRICESCRRR